MTAEPARKRSSRLLGDQRGVRGSATGIDQRCQTTGETDPDPTRKLTPC
jgi:hypothetical protein